MLGYPPGWISRAKAAGVDGFTAKGCVKLEPVRVWIEAHRKELESSAGDLPLRDQKLVEEIRKLRIVNEREAGKLVELSWVAERFAKLGGEFHAIRTRSEAEDAVKFSETGGEIDRCRTVLRGIWDALFQQVQECGKHFET